MIRLVDRGAIKRYRRRRNERMRKRGVRVDADWQESKHPRDESGKFTSGAGGLSSGNKIVVNGPKTSRKFVEKYVADHPGIKTEIKKYRGVLDRVKNFEKNNPGAEDGTYDAITGEKKEYKDGYCVTFHQNLTEDDPFGGYDDGVYSAMCAIAAEELGADGPDIGYFGNAEVSFNCKDLGKAKAFAIAHNQHSVYDVAADDIWVNPYYDRKSNPIKGK